MFVKNSCQIKNTGLYPWIHHECQKKKIIHASSVQQAVIPIIISGKDTVVFSRTGTGKTLSYILPLIHINFVNGLNCFIGIIVPTLELGLQIYETYNHIGKNRKVSSIFLEKTNKQQDFKKRWGGCLISTIFSLVKYFENFHDYIKCLYKVLVFDEVDLLIRPDNFALIKKIILKVAPLHIHMFGVTNTNIFRYTKAFKYQKNIFFYNEKHSKYNFFSEIKHEYIYCSHQFKLKFLLALLKHKERKKIIEEKTSPILIFFKTKQKSEKFIQLLKKNKIFASNLHHEMDIYQRALAIQMVKRGIVKIITSTDLGSRGINFSFITSVINVDMPEKLDTYLHRIGRIGRFKKKGYCLNLINKNEIDFIGNFERNMGIFINKSKLVFKENISCEILK